ncbi:sensor histidine kinase KdpD [Cutibacterium acnes]|nr:histidine kinase [Cutibacterium acnes]KPG66456.1 histidine kinase [Cutibacterium acnes]PZA02093.1 sensor histidine kinase KdpD [Cutibacterium acnes]
MLLGAAPGVGKTYAMLDEGKHLRAGGSDVVIAVVETHGRAATAAMTEGLEVVPRHYVERRGIELPEMDLDEVLARHPDVALVDELAHTNAPGSRNEKRWQDVEELLEAGIDVISTVNIQHIESLNDVVEQITGVPQRETVPDTVLRRASQVEVVDLAPQALRDRLSSGKVYPAERIDAALSNYFRLGNLTALRELALLWVADEVDHALADYRSEHGIDSRWEARERVVVALTGGREGETLLRRGARIAVRAGGGELLAVHVTTEDGLRSPHPGELARQRGLVDKLGGSFHQLVGDDIPETLIEFAKSVNATQLVIGASRRGKLSRLLTGHDVEADIIRASGAIDVHIVSHDAQAKALRLPRMGGALSTRRRIAGFAVLAVFGPLLTWLLVSSRSPEALTTDVLAYELLAVVVALVGGAFPSLIAALASGFALDYFFTKPFYTVTVNEPLHLVALLLYLLTAALVSVVVDRAARKTRVARRTAAESGLLQSVAGLVLRGEDAVESLLSRATEAFGLSGARLMTDGKVVANWGTTSDQVTEHRIDDHTVVEFHGPEPDASERRLMSVIAAQLGTALEQRQLEETAKAVEPLAATDRVRTALLSAVGHDLRRPLAAATAAVSGLRSEWSKLSDQDRADLLETADEALSQLANLVTDLLDVSRLQSGVLGVSVMPVDPAEVIMPALDELSLGPADVEIDLGSDVPEMVADPALLQRVVVNLLSNALRYEPAGSRVRLAESSFANQVEIRVIDHGPGIPEDRRDDVMVPFQRLGDTDSSVGLGLGLALSKGFVEGMDGTLALEDTPGGGLTMVISLPRVGVEEASAQ